MEDLVRLTDFGLSRYHWSLRRGLLRKAEPPRNLIANVPLLRKMLEFVSAHPEAHNQENWFFTPMLAPGPSFRTPEYIEKKFSPNVEEWSCGTTACLAGHIALHEGWIPTMEDSSGLMVRRNADEGDLKVSSAREVATNALEPEYSDEGLNVNGLWSAENTLIDLWYMANILTAGEIEVPSEYLVPGLKPLC